MTWIGSPNFTAGRGGKKVELIVVHWIVGNLAAADSVFKNPAAETSAHYAVGEGAVHQYVKESDTAWHAGNFDVNQRSIGIEHQGGPNLPISERTYQTSANLIANICRRYGLNPYSHIKPHKQFVATQCPGTLDLGKLAKMVEVVLNGGEDDLITPQDRDIVRIINSEVKGYPFNETHQGKHDEVEMRAWTGKPLRQLIMEGWKQAEAWRNRRLQLEQRVKELEAELQASYEPVSEQLYRKK